MPGSTAPCCWLDEGRITRRAVCFDCADDDLRRVLRVVALAIAYDDGLGSVPCADNSAIEWELGVTLWCYKTGLICEHVNGTTLEIFVHIARSAPDEDHQRTVVAAIRKPPSDWKRPSGRPNHT